MTTPLDPVIAQIIPLLPLRDPDNMTPQSARDALSALAAARAAVPPPPVMSAENTKVKGEAGFLAARVYRNTSGTSPTVLFFHGGGWVAGDLDTHDRQARLLAIETGAVVVSVDYRRPPEVRFPGAFEDAFAAAKDVVERIAEFGGDAETRRRRRRQRGRQSRGRTAIACATPASSCRRNCWSIPSPTSSAISRTQRRTRASPRAAENAEGYFLSRAVMQWFCGVISPTPPTAPTGARHRCAPKILAGLAPAVVTTAWFDPLRDEGKAYADALNAAGVPTSI